jgi:hypothetical protein
MINGQTGKVSGHAPLSFWKIFILSVLGIAAIALAFALFGNNIK